MILFTMLLVAALFVLFVALVGGATIGLVFGDVIVFVLLIVLLVKLFNRKS